MCTPMVRCLLFAHTHTHTHTQVAPGAALDDMILEPDEIMRLEVNKANVPG